jgi:hypothetical protein
MGVKEIKEEKNERDDPVAITLNTPREKMAQLTHIPSGGIIPIAMTLTMAQWGKENAFDGRTPMEYCMEKIFELSRSKEGRLLGIVSKLAQTKVEVAAEQSEEGRKYLVD